VQSECVPALIAALEKTPIGAPLERLWAYSSSQTSSARATGRLPFKFGHGRAKRDLVSALVLALAGHCDREHILAATARRSRRTQRGRLAGLSRVCFHFASSAHKRVSDCQAAEFLTVLQVFRIEHRTLRLQRGGNDKCVVDG
jgi:hypothetical protein